MSIDKDTKTRRRLFVAAAGLATLAGVGGAWALRRNGREEPAEPAPGFWAAQWPGAQGGQIALQSFQGRPLLVNFWATWCAPCVEELPLINAFYKKNSANGFQVLGIAVDRAPLVQDFLKKTPLEFPVAVAGVGAMGLARSLGDLSGGLPFTLVLNAAGQVVLRKSGPLTEADLAALAGLSGMAGGSGLK